MFIKIIFFCLLLIQQVPPSPPVQGKNSPTPPGLSLDNGIIILVMIALIIIFIVKSPKYQKPS